ncbi:MAG: peptidase M3 [Denitrovibrio sp.]|nr:MAG: peptidase M3 [Denitrovibrio sp.]
MFVNYRTDILENAVEELTNILDTNRNSINELLNKTNKTYKSFIRPLMSLDTAISEFFTPIGHLNFVNNSDQTQEVYNASMPLLTEYSTQIGQNNEIYEAVQSVFENEKDELTSAQVKVLEDMQKGFRLSGVHLPEEQKKRLMEINLEISQLSTDFAQNVLKDTDDFELVTADEADVAGIPKPDLKAAKCDEGYKFTLKMPSYLAYMTYGPNRDIREKLYKAYCTRAPQNADIIEKMLTLKTEKANILGFDRFSDLSLATKNAKSPEDVINFLNDLAEKAYRQAGDEINDLKELANIDDLQAFDTAYYSEQLRRVKCGYDEQIYRPYFELHSVVNGLFSFIEKLFGVSFKEVQVPVWHESVNAYDLVKNNETFARIYTDLTFRKGKRDGAWMNNWQVRHMDSEDQFHPATALICGNFPQSSPDSPSLLRHSDVVTLFHEMGHAIHHLFSDVDEADVSGVNGVEWDVIEFPSQFLELFAYNKDVLKMFAKHHETGELISDEMIDKLNNVKQFMSATALLRQLEFGTLDMRIHERPHTADEVQEILDDVRKKTALIKPPAYNKFQHGFSHIFAGGYSAGYYSYKWAERLSCDAYSIFVDKGVFDKVTGEKFLASVLSKGGSADPMDLFEKFAGRQPDNTSLLRVNGIN